MECWLNKNDYAYQYIKALQQTFMNEQEQITTEAIGEQGEARCRKWEVNLELTRIRRKQKMAAKIARENLCNAIDS